MLCSAVSGQGLPCLQRPICPKTYGYYGVVGWVSSCRSWSDAAFISVWSGSTLFAQVCQSTKGYYGTLIFSVDSDHVNVAFWQNWVLSWPMRKLGAEVDGGALEALIWLHWSLCQKWNKNMLTHISLETPKKVISEWCRSRSDNTEHGIWSGSPLQIVWSFFSRNI